MFLKRQSSYPGTNVFNYALYSAGSKARPGADVDKLRGTDPTRKLYPTPAPTGIKRESPSGPSGSGLAKRPKLGGPQSVTPLGRPIDIDRKPSPGPQTHQYDEIAKEGNATMWCCEWKGDNVV